jgi:hypothetical protein
MTACDVRGASRHLDDSLRFQRSDRTTRWPPAMSEERQSNSMQATSWLLPPRRNQNLHPQRRIRTLKPKPPATVRFSSQSAEINHVRGPHLIEWIGGALGSLGLFLFVYPRAESIGKGDEGFALLVGAVAEKVDDSIHGRNLTNHFGIVPAERSNPIAAVRINSWICAACERMQEAGCTKVRAKHRVAIDMVKVQSRVRRCGKPSPGSFGA